MDEQKCPLDINICPFVHWTNRNVHWTSKCPFVHWTNGHCLMANTLVSYPHGVRLSQITSLQLPCIVNVTCLLDINVHSSIGRTEMSIGHSKTNRNVHWTFKYISIRPLDKQKCPLDIQMPIRPLDEQKCPLDIQMSIRPLDEWTNGHCLKASTLVSNPHGVRLSQITSLQLPWYCKRYMSIEHK